jgi:hypothetical protein
MLRQTGHEPNRATDVTRLWSNRIAAAPDNIINGIGVDTRPRDQRLDGVRAEISRMKAGKAALFAANGGAHSVDNIGFSHVSP